MNQLVGRGLFSITLGCVAVGGALSVVGGCSSQVEETEHLAKSSDELTIHAPDEAVNDFFGTSVIADTQTLVVGDYAAKSAIPSGVELRQRGQVHVYARSGDIQEWQPIQIIKPDTIVETSEVHFGQRLALKGNLLVISAHRDDGANDQQEGAFYVYARPGAGQPFARVGKFTEPVPTAGRQFGMAIATNGNFIAVGRGKEGESNQTHIYRVSGNTVTYAYAIELIASEVAITDAGVLIARTTSPNLQAYHLQQDQAVPLSGSELLAGSFWRLQASGNSFAALESAGAPRVIVGTVDTARVTSTASFTVPSDVDRESLSYRENGEILLRTNDLLRPALLKFERQGGTWSQTGVIHGPAEAHAIGSNFGYEALTSTSEFVAAGFKSGENGKVFVLSPEPNGTLDGAVFDQQQLLARDACGAQCGAQSFASTQFGRHAAIAGDVAAVTTIELSTTATRESALHVYTRQGSTWQHSGQFFLGSDQRARDVAVDSGRVYVGRGTKAGPGGFSDGKVDVYERDGNGVWSRTATLSSSDGSVAASFIGESIAAYGDTVALGTHGFVYVFQRDAGGVWTETHKVPVTPLVSSTPLAHSVALSADHLVVGARLDSSVLSRQGSVFVYRRSDYALEQKLAALVSGNRDLEFGYSVALHGTTLAVGVPNGGSGLIEIFERTGAGTTPWQRKGTVSPQNGNDVRAGTSISLNDTHLLIGAVGDGHTGAQGGAAYLVPRVGGAFDLSRARILLPRDNGRGDGAAFGWDVQLSGNRAIVSAPTADVDGSGDAGAAFVFDDLLDADGDGLFVSEDCNDTDGVHRRCSVSAANMSFEQGQAAWTADSGSFTYNSTNRTDGVTSLRLNAGGVRLRGPAFPTQTLREVGTTLALDIKRPTVNGNAVSLFMSAPAFGLYESLVGTIDISALPAGKWVTVSAPFTAQQRDVLLRQNTDVRFHVAFNTGGPNLYVDRLHFSGAFETRLAPPPPSGPFFGTLNVTSDWGAGYCVTVRLNNAGTTPTAGWQLVVNPNGTTMTSNWNAAFSGSNPITINSNQPWNSSIPAGATNHDVSAGFCANRPNGGGALASITSATRL